MNAENNEMRPRNEAGWRDGRPLEDPEKMKRWGFINAKPSEYLVHVRRGALRERTSGQGATCFKWPFDAVAVVPTSLQRLTFRADQITRERVGVEVVGLAVYRIADPVVAYRVLNFSYPERAQEKLEATLSAMFVGATRRLVANLTVDECLEKRKSALADELLSEIAPVVGGRGHPDDRATAGWGVVVDSIEVQEVRVLSDRVFDAMQAPFRAALDQRARTARAAAEQEVSTRESACERAVEEAHIADDLARATARSEAACSIVTLDIEQARAKLEAAEIRTQAEAATAAVARARWSADHARRRAELEVATAEGRARAEVSLADARAQHERAAAEATSAIAEGLPELAAAIAQPIGELRVTQIGAGDSSPTGAVVQGVAAVLELARQVTGDRGQV